MVQGRLRKYFEETVLLEQKFVVNDSMNVQVSPHTFVASFLSIMAFDANSVVAEFWFIQSISSPACV